jgi:hypothetical protein
MTVSALHIRYHPNLLTKKDHEELVKSLGGNIAEIKKKIDVIQEENLQLKKLVTDRDNEIYSLWVPTRCPGSTKPLLVHQSHQLT